MPAPPGSTAAPELSAATAYSSPGGKVYISGKGFSGVAPQNQVTIGSRSLPVLASSPVSIVAAVPADMPVGDSGPLVVKTLQGTAPSRPRPIAVVRLRVEGSNRTLHKGQQGHGRVIIEGTRDAVTVQITNASPAVVQLANGQNQITAKSSGGSTNVIKVKYTAVGAGAFNLTTILVEPPAGGKKNM